MDWTRRRFLGGLTSGVGALASASPLSAFAGRLAAAEEPPARKLGVALVGLGRLSEGQLVPAFKSTKYCRLAALVSGKPDKARAWAQQNGVPEKNIYDYQNFDRIRDNPDVDVVYVVLPNSMHAEYTIRAARAGKHVLCEKPMAISVKECDGMIAACKSAGRQLAIGYRCHFEPHNMEMMRLARDKVFGAVKVVEASAGFRIGDPTQWRLNKAMSGGGSLLDIGLYALQAARYITGEEPTSVTAQQTITDPVKFKDIDESILFSLRFPSGVLATCSSSYATRLGRFWAGAENGWFEVSPASSYRGIRGRTATGNESPKEMGFPEIDQFAAEMDDFARCILEGRPTRVPGEEGRRDQRIMAAIYQAASSGRAVAL